MDENTKRPEPLLQEIQKWPIYAQANLFEILAEKLTVDEIVSRLTKAKLSREVQEIRNKL